MKYFYFIMFIFFINGLSQTREISGTISGTLYSDSTYIVVDNLFIASSTTLTIQAGTTLQLEDSVRIEVEGTFMAVGTSTDSIKFTRRDVGDEWLGIRLRSASNDSRIEYCEIEYGHARPDQGEPLGNHYGGGIGVSNCSPIIRNNYIHHCKAVRSGGAIGCYNSAHPLIENNLMEYDTTGVGGGAILVLWGSSPTLRNNIMRYNYTTDVGGAIDVNGASGACNPIIENNTITNNKAGGNGGGISVKVGSSAPTIRNNFIAYNVANRGGGISCESTGIPIIYNNIIVKDTSTGNSSGGGGGISININTNIDSVFNNTIAYNYCNTTNNLGSGGGIYVRGASTNAITKSNIVWGNDYGGSVDENRQIYVSSGSITVDSCVVQDGYTGNGNSSGNPLFTDSSNDDYSLKSGSSSIDIGSKELYSTLDYFDYYRGVDGDSDGTAGFDVGAYEFMPAGQIISQTSQDYYFVVNSDSEAVLNFSSLENTDGTLSIYAYKNKYPHDKGSGKCVKRWYDIRSTGIGDFTSSLKLYYTDSEFTASGISDESGLEFYKNSGNNWVAFGGTVNTNKNSVLKNNVQSFSRFTFADVEDSPLPVVLTSFRVLQSNNSVLVEWISASEINNQGFALYRAEKTKDDYQLISDFTMNSDLKGLGNSSSGKVYRYFDENVKSNSNYYYRLYDVDNSGYRQEIGNISISTNDLLGNMIPQKFKVYQNYPNPFNSTTTIKFDLPVGQNVKLSVYNLLGEVVLPIFEGELEAGHHKYILDFNQMSSGIYVYQLITTESSYINKMILMK